MCRFSRADISALVQEACRDTFRKLQMTTHFKKVTNAQNGSTVYEPCDPETEEAIQMNLMEIKPEEIQFEPTSFVN